VRVHSFLLFISLCFFTAGVLAETRPLNVGEVMTIRLLDLSSSKRTVLLNRGIEDGIVEETHARFFLTTGVIARAVAVQVAPNRSVWSVYRLVYPDEMVQGNVLQMGITRTMQTTDDPTKAIRAVPTVAGRLPRNTDSKLAESVDRLDQADVNRIESGRTAPASQIGRGSFYGRAQ
jgi:hypothetical protein